jgi:hypothetical protein
MDEEVKTPWDTIKGFGVARCCGTCDCNMPNQKAMDFKKEVEKEGLPLVPGLKWPYEIWCTKHEEETCKYGVCPEWEED